MYLKTDRIVVTLKDYWNFRSYKTADRVGQFILDPTALTGWDDGATVRRDATKRPVSDGDFVEPYTLSARLITLSGTAVATSRGELQRMRDQVMALFQDGEYIPIRVETSASTRFAMVGLENNIQWVQQLDNVAIFRIELYAPDPHIYGSERVVTLGSTTDAGGGLKYELQYPLNYNPVNPNVYAPAVTNNGNVPSWPKIRVTGDYVSGFTITDGWDKKVTYTGPVTLGSPVEIDMARGTAIQNGVDRSTMLSDREWFSIPAVDSLYPQFKPTQAASGWCDIIYRDTYI
jgi:phage-related protein